MGCLGAAAGTGRGWHGVGRGGINDVQNIQFEMEYACFASASALTCSLSSSPSFSSSSSSASGLFPAIRASGLCLVQGHKAQGAGAGCLSFFYCCCCC